MNSANMSNELVQVDATITAVPVDETTGLSPAQMIALEELWSGKTATKAAAVAGVARSTLYNWLGQDYRFRAALNRGRREFQQAISFRLEQMAADATECVAGAIQSGDVKAALEILKRTGALAPANIGSDDELILQLEDCERNDTRNSRVTMAELAFGFGKTLPDKKQLPKPR